MLTIAVRWVLFLFLAVSLLGFPSFAYTGDIYVITGTLRSQREAQERAALTGGWVLDTDLYTKLSRGHFAVVRGPFKERKEAQLEVQRLRQSAAFRKVFSQDAGQLRLPVKDRSSASRSAVFAALLGEIAAETTEQPGGANPCEPQEPYQLVTFSYLNVDRKWDKATEQDQLQTFRKTLDLGGFWVIKRTGEIQRMRVCTE